METTRHTVVDALSQYLQGKCTLASLVDWAEQQIMDADFESESVRDAVARLGLADVRAFGLTWEDCQRLLANLGYSARVEILA
jgi:hypothetical protein